MLRLCVLNVLDALFQKMIALALPELFDVRCFAPRLEKAVDEHDRQVKVLEAL